MSEKRIESDQTVGLDEYFGGKVWAAEVTGLDSEAPGGFVRRFLETESRRLSRSGRTGTRWVYVHDVPDGAVVETQEPRPKYGRRYWVREGDLLREISRAEVRERLQARDTSAEAAR